MTTERLVSRFLKYVRIHSSSKDGVEGCFPSTPEQLDLGKVLVADLKLIGLHDAVMDANGYVFATLPGNLPAGTRAPVLGLLAHMDTYPGVSGKNVQPVIHENYDGKDIALSGDSSQVIRVSDNPELSQFMGQAIITTDGTTLLGADDKAGIAEIMEAIERLKEDLRPRPTIRVGFTPDEEVGNGTAYFDLKAFGADIAYTLDGSSADEVENETFCADSAIVKITGQDVHPGYAKGKMTNALRVAAELVTAIPQDIRPETTEKREGYLHPIQVSGDVSEATLNLLVRDFTEQGLHEKEALLRKITKEVCARFPKAHAEIEIKESYRNMRYQLDQRPEVVEKALQAVNNVGLKAKLTSIRGGTDGSRLSAIGLLTPNICGGGKNFHSKQEWIPVPVLEKCTQIVIELAHLWAQG